MNVFVADEPIARDALHTLCTARGLAWTRDEPWTSGVAYATWSDGETTVALVDDARSMAQLVRVDEDAPGLAGALAEAFALAPMGEVLDRARRATTRADKIRSLYRAHALRLVDGEPDRHLVELECERLGDEDAHVRWAAARLLAHRFEPVVERALASAAATFPELSGVHRRVRAQGEAARDGTLDDAPTESWQELLARAREGLASGHPQRAAQATDVLLADSLEHTEALLLRAKAYAALGDPTLALTLLGAAEAAGRLERDAREGKDQAAAEALLDEITAARAGISDDGGDVEQEALVSWLQRWADDGREVIACGAVMAAMGRVPALDAVFAFVAGRHRHDRRLLERASDRAPRSAWCLRALANAQKTDRPDDAIALYERALALEGPTLREEAIIDRLGEAFESSRRSAPAELEAIVLEDLTSLAYDERRWEDAIAYGDRLVVANPASATGWQWRANARTFALRHEEAVDAYREGLRVLDEAYAGGGLPTGSDPRPSMCFNLAGVLAKLSRRAPALDQLRRAVRADAKWGLDAQNDDYFEALWDDADFMAIAAGEEAALVLDEEREAGFIASLLGRALTLSQRGAHDQATVLARRAATLAELIASNELAARALAVEGRVLALAGSTESAVTRAQQAEALAGDLAPDVRAEIAHALGIALHAARTYDRAAAAYRRALDLRKAAQGEHHPSVAKSLGDLARLASDRGEPAADVYRDAIEVLERFLAGDTEDAELRREAQIDLTISRSNLAENLRKNDDLEGALAMMEACLGTIAAPDGLGQPFFDHALDVAERLVAESEDGQRDRARALVEALESLLVSGTEPQRRERTFWLRLRRFVRNTVRQGVPEATLAGMLSEALRGGDKLPPRVRRIPEIAGLKKALAERATRYPTLLAMAVVALSTAEANGNLDEALENLQELSVAAL